MKLSCINCGEVYPDFWVIDEIGTPAMFQAKINDVGIPLWGCWECFGDGKEKKPVCEINYLKIQDSLHAAYFQMFNKFWFERLDTSSYYHHNNCGWSTNNNKKPAVVMYP